MSKWNWIEALDREQLEEALLQVATADDKMRLALIDLAEDRKRIQFRINRLRREAGEIK